MLADEPPTIQMTRYILTSLVSCFVIGVAQPAISAESKTFSVERDRGYRPVAPALNAFLKHHKAAAGKHTLCVVGYERSTKEGHRPTRSSWVFWAKGNSLTLWEPAAAGSGATAQMLLQSRRVLDLDRDVVEHEADVKGSAYLVSRDWVDKVIRDCQTHGRTYTLVVSE